MTNGKRLVRLIFHQKLTFNFYILHQHFLHKKHAKLQQKAEISKKNAKVFARLRKKQYFCTRF